MKSIIDVANTFWTPIIAKRYFFCLVVVLLIFVCKIVRVNLYLRSVVLRKLIIDILEDIILKYFYNNHIVTYL